MAQNTEVLFAAGRITNDEMGEIQGTAGAAGLFLFSGWSGTTNGYVIGQLDVAAEAGGNQSGNLLVGEPQPSGWGRYISATLGTTYSYGIFVINANTMEANLGGSLTPIGGNVSNMTATRESTTMHQAGARDGEYAIIMPGGLARGVNSNDEGYALVYYVSALTFKESVANIVYPEVEWASLPDDMEVAANLAARGIVVLRDASSSPFGWNFV